MRDLGTSTSLWSRGWECLNLFCPLLYSKKQNKTLKLVSKLVNSFIFECVILILLTADGKTLFKFLAKENRSLHAAQPVNSSCRKHTESISAVKIFAYKLNQALVTGKKIFGKIVRFRSFTEI